MTPRDAVSLSAKLIRDHLNDLRRARRGRRPAAGRVGAASRPRPRNENLDKSVEELELSVRSYNCLKNANIRTLRELVQKTEGEMLKTKNFGRKSLNEIKEILATMGSASACGRSAGGTGIGGGRASCGLRESGIGEGGLGSATRVDPS